MIIVACGESNVCVHKDKVSVYISSIHRKEKKAKKVTISHSKVSTD